MSNMFCFQCEQTVGGKGCTVAGACGKTADTSNLQDDLTLALINFAIAAEGHAISDADAILMMEGLFTTITNVSFDDVSLNKLVAKVEAAGQAKRDANKVEVRAVISQGDQLFAGDPDIVSLRSLLLLGLRGMAAYAYHAMVLGKMDAEVNQAMFDGMVAVGKDHSIEEWLNLLMKFGKDNFRCMEVLDDANTSAYGNPTPTEVTMKIEKGPFIVVSGHDLHDLKMLLEQTEGKGVNIYTHGEMLPAHAYPELKKYSQLKGNFGTAWQNQQKEFKNVPAAFLFTTNCLMPPKTDYADRVFTTAVVEYPGLVHIADGKDGQKDFSAVIDKAIALGGFSEEVTMTGINGGSKLLTGFGHATVLGAAGQVIDAVNAGALKHIFLVGGCDGAKPGRNYFTDFVKQTPADTLVLTLACGKFRFNDLEIGNIGPFPRIMDMGQCNDSYSAIKVAVALAGAFNCSVNDLPLTLILSWYEQKAVCVLLTLLALGVKNIYLGPTLPAFVSANVLNVLVEQFGIRPTSNVDYDMQQILGA